MLIVNKKNELSKKEKEMNIIFWDKAWNARLAKKKGGREKKGVQTRCSTKRQMLFRSAKSYSKETKKKEKMNKCIRKKSPPLAFFQLLRHYAAQLWLKTRPPFLSHLSSSLLFPQIKKALLSRIFTSIFSFVNNDWCFFHYYFLQIFYFYIYFLQSQIKLNGLLLKTSTCERRCLLWFSHSNKGEDVCALRKNEWMNDHRK